MESKTADAKMYTVECGVSGELKIGVPRLGNSRGMKADKDHIKNKIYREKRIPMTALWCPAFNNYG